MNRGFVVLFVPFGVDISVPSNHQMLAAIGENEAEVAEAFGKAYGDQRQLVGLLSLEEIEDHRDLILDYARAQGVELDRAPLPPR